MAIAFDNSTNGGSSGSGTSHTFSHTCSGSDRILFVYVRMAGTTDRVTAITYNGVSMTKIDAQFGINNTGTTLYYLIAPATGSNTVAITKEDSATSALAVSYTGAKQSGVPDAKSKGESASTTGLTGNITTVADNCWGVMAVTTGAGNTQAGTGSHLRQQGDNTGVIFFDTNADLTPAGAKSMAFTCDSGAASYVIASFAPALSAKHLTTDNAASADPHTTASITPTANNLVLAFIRVGDDAITVDSVTGNSLTWVQVLAAQEPGGNGIFVYRALGASPTAGAVTINLSASAVAAWSIVEVSGIKTSGTNGSDAVVQAVSAVNASTNSLTATLAAFSSADNATIGCFYYASGTARTLSVGTGFSVLGNVTDTGIGGIISEYKRATDTTVDASCDGTATYMMGAAIELAFDTGVQNLVMTAVQGSFTLTGQSAILIKGKIIFATVGNFLMTGFDVVLRLKAWTNKNKSNTTFTNQSKNSSSWTNRTKS